MRGQHVLCQHGANNLAVVAAALAVVCGDATRNLGVVTDAPRVDRVLSSVSGGRLSIARLLSALGAPVVELTTVGTKTGKRRSVPVLGFRDGRKWVVVASNWGRDRQPAWYHNLRARPDVELSFGGETEQYVAAK